LPEALTPAVRELTPEDIPSGLRLCRASGWNQTESDWAMLIATGTFRAAVVEGRVVGTGGIVRYGQRLGWVAMILVDPESRGRGIGTAIMSDLLARTTGLASVGLDATPLGRPVYERLGFRPQGELVRLEAAPSRRRPPPPVDVRPLAGRDLEAVREWDLEVFGADRSRVLRWAVQRAPEYAWCAAEGVAIDGYCFGRHGYRCHQVGPLVARHPSVAERLLAACLSPHPDRRFYLDTPAYAGEWLSSVQRAGFVAQRPLTRMFRKGDRVPGQLDLQFAILGPEFG
jgi:GNAT superfamily N-acetyltransferase